MKEAAHALHNEEVAEMGHTEAGSLAAAAQVSSRQILVQVVGFLLRNLLGLEIPHDIKQHL